MLDNIHWTKIKSVLYSTPIGQFKVLDGILPPNGDKQHERGREHESGGAHGRESEKQPSQKHVQRSILLTYIAKQIN